MSENGFRRLRRFRPDGPARFSTWLYAVARNLCLDWHRNEFGWRRVFEAIAQMPALDQETFRGPFAERLPIEDLFLELEPRPPAPRSSRRSTGQGTGSKGLRRPILQSPHPSGAGWYRLPVVSEKGDLPAGAPVVGRADSFEDTARWHSLASRIQQGDKGAEEELATRFHGRVRALAASWMDGSDVAQDIAQETVIAVIQALRAGKLREAEKLPAFVLSTARNLVNNRCRQVARAREVSEDPPAAPGGDGFALAVAAERRTLVRTALARLNAVDRRILLFTLIENMTPREIAPLVGLNPGAVRARKTRAVRAVIEEVGRASRKRLADHIGRSGRRT